MSRDPNITPAQALFIDNPGLREEAKNTPSLPLLTSELRTATIDGQLYYVAEGGPKWELDGGLNGKFTIGAWYHDGTFARFDGGAESGEFGPYVLVEQRLYRENPADKDDDQGLGAFLRFGHVADDVSVANNHVLLGVTYTGAFDGRDADVVGFAASWVDVTDDPFSGFDRSSELTFEAFYKIQIAPWCSLQPDLQYVVNPGGVSGVDDAWLATLRSRWPATPVTSRSSERRPSRTRPQNH